ncbi:sensor histidine kinase [Actinoplanes sp. CA-252034]|uniref:sensor histidine kinase n=1 Tax=Actinoplanes sp. CA-252034 TaxID=3239906 RepID=UPI003D995E55
MLSPPPAWIRAGHYLLAVAAGAAGWIATAADRLSSPLTPADEDLVGALLVVDLLLGVTTLALVPLRRRAPPALGVVTAAVLPFSASGVGAAAFAIGAMAARRHRGHAVTVIVVATISSIAAELALPGFSPGSVVTVVVFVAVCLAVGAYVGTRRDLMTSLYEQARTAGSERLLAAAAARDAERTRIAREMHDVLAHRISLVALHAGALTYRDDLTRDETVGTAGIIQGNARLALAELREVLGVLRSGTDEPADEAEPPQPTLTELPALVADTAEAGTTVRLDCTVPVHDLPETVSRTAFRIVQESLTNARRHAPGSPVTVALSRTGTDLAVTTANPAPPGGPRGEPGVGLIGLAERAALAGGSLTAGIEADGMFVVRARLPWPV